MIRISGASKASMSACVELPRQSSILRRRFVDGSRHQGRPARSGGDERLDAESTVAAETMVVPRPASTAAPVSPQEVQEKRSQLDKSRL